MKLENKIKKLVADHFNYVEIPSHKISESARFKEDFGADSLDTVEITMDLETAFNIEISDEDAEKLLTVGNVIEYIKEQKGCVAE